MVVLVSQLRYCLVCMFPNRPLIAILSGIIIPAKPIQYFYESIMLDFVGEATMYHQQEMIQSAFHVSLHDI